VYSTFSIVSIVMVDSLLKNCPLRIVRFNRMRYIDAIYGCDQTRSVEANLLDDGIDDTLTSVGATGALREIPWPHELDARVAAKLFQSDGSQGCRAMPISRSAAIASARTAAIAAC